MRFEQKIVCTSCRGTGLYVGLGERNGSAVVCSKCKGTGCETFILEYQPFVERKRRHDVRHVLQVNPGIVCGEGKNKQYDITEDFGGQSYDSWWRGEPFPQKSEMRAFTCPAWWYQSADYSKKPDWKECNFGGSFSGCKHFPEKERCWVRFDAERLVLISTT